MCRPTFHLRKFLFNQGAGRKFHSSAGYLYLTYVERFPMVYQFYSFRDAIGKVHTDPLGCTETPPPLVVPISWYLCMTNYTFLNLLGNPINLSLSSLKSYHLKIDSIQKGQRPFYYFFLCRDKATSYRHHVIDFFYSLRQNEQYDMYNNFPIHKGGGRFVITGGVCMYFSHFIFWIL